MATVVVFNEGSTRTVEDFHQKLYKCYNQQYALKAGFHLTEYIDLAEAAWG